VAKKSAGASSSTEPRAPRVPRAWPFEQASPVLVTTFARAQGLGAGDIVSASAAVRAHLDDRDRIKETLRRLPALDLVLLEILAEAGGRLRTETLFHVAHARTGLDAKVAGSALQLLDARFLTVALVSKPDRGSPIAALLAPAAEHVAALVRGVSLPPGDPPPDARPTQAPSYRRDVLAVAGLTAHRALRYNHDRSPNGSQLPRFGKGLAAPDVRIDALLAEARHLRLLGAIGDAYAPIADALLRSSADVDEELAAWLPVAGAGWTPVEAVERAAIRSLMEHEYPTIMPTADDHRMLSKQAALRVKGACGVEIVEAGSHAWIRRRPAGKRGGDGHVTPSFDVMLGPGADLEIVATISLGCELTRLDRVLTFRITPASVAAGLSSGLPAAALVAALDRVGRHPLPSNVRAMVDDWIAHHRTANITRAWLVRVPEEVASLLAKSPLAKSILDRPAPGVLAIDPSVRRSDLVKILAKHRVSLGPPISLDEAVMQRDEERYAPESSWWEKHALVEEKPKALVRPLLLPLLFEGDPVLAEKVAATRAAGFPAPPPPAVPVSAPPPVAVLPAKAPPATHPPHPADFERQSEDFVLEILQAACAASVLVRLLVRSGDGVAFHDVTPSSIQARGASSALLAIDPDTDEGRVFHLPDVLAVVRPPSPHAG
jgi:Helicase conserved C-terminal domain